MTAPQSPIHFLGLLIADFYARDTNYQNVIAEQARTIQVLQSELAAASPPDAGESPAANQRGPKPKPRSDAGGGATA